MAYPLLKTTMRMTSEEFLAWESGDDRRYELIEGQVVVMESASEEHQTVAANLVTEMRRHLRGTGCKALPALDVLCNRTNCLVPDVVVFCSRRTDGKRGLEDCPLLVEVLSPSTSSFDRNGKFAAYRSLAALREYMIVDWKRRLTEVHRLTDEGFWTVTRYTAKDDVYLASINLALSGELIFDDLDHAA